MIQSFSCSATQQLFETGYSPAFASIAQIARRKLQQLDSAASLDALQAPYSNAFEASTIDRKTKHCICVCGHWYLYFFWSEEGPSHVAIENTHATGDLMMFNNMPPTHPGEVLREDYLVPLGIQAPALAQALHVPLEQIERLLEEKRSVDPELALRLVRYFGGDAQSWLNLQQSYDLKLTEQAMLEKIVETISPIADKKSA